MNLALVVLAASSLALTGCGGSTVSPQASSSSLPTASASASGPSSLDPLGSATASGTASPSASVPGTAPAAPAPTTSATSTSATSRRSAPAPVLSATRAATAEATAKPAASPARTSPGATKSATTKPVASSPSSASCPASPSPLGMTDNVFTPATLSVARNTRVNVTNCGNNAHTWTSSAAGFDSGQMVKGVSFEVTFGTAGTYAFLCSYHSGMTGSITVR